MNTVGPPGTVVLVVVVAAVLLLAVAAWAIWLTTRRPGLPPPGWYPDPAGRARLRWFDGRDWTSSTQN